MMPLFRFKKIVFTCILVITSLSIPFFFFSSCSHKRTKDLYELSKEEREWMTKFFGYLTFYEGGVYTLWGSKPMTLVVVPHISEEAFLAWQKSLTEEEKEYSVSIEDPKFEENWEKWVKIRDRFPIKRFIFEKSEVFSNESCSSFFFVDILKTAMVIQENYDVFKKIVGFDFHPLEEVLELKNSKSKFWKKIHENSTALMWGLLFGFGKTNSQLFHWKFFDRPIIADDFLDHLPYVGTHDGVKGDVDFTIEYLQIPAFISYIEEDEVVNTYREEKEKIRKIYKGKDSLDVTLKELTRFRLDPYLSLWHSS